MTHHGHIPKLCPECAYPLTAQRRCTECRCVMMEIDDMDPADLDMLVIMGILSPYPDGSYNLTEKGRYALTEALDAAEAALDNDD